MKEASKEKAIYEYIVKHITENMYSPSIRDICENTDTKSTSTVFYHLRKLRKKGLIEIDDNRSRGIMLPGYQLVKKETES